MNRFIDYFHNGGFPEGALLAAKRNYLTSVYQKIYLGDIAARNAITNTFGLKIMIKKLAESIKQPISFNRIANIVSTTGSKLSTTSAIKYVEYAESAWLLQRINNIAAKLAEKAVSYTHLRAHETGRNLVCRLLLEKKKNNIKKKNKKRKKKKTS